MSSRGRIRLSQREAMASCGEGSSPSVSFRLLRTVSCEGAMAAIARRAWIIRLLVLLHFDHRTKLLEVCERSAAGERPAEAVVHGRCSARTNLGASILIHRRDHVKDLLVRRVLAHGCAHTVIKARLRSAQSSFGGRTGGCGIAGRGQLRSDVHCSMARSSQSLIAPLASLSNLSKASLQSLRSLLVRPSSPISSAISLAPARATARPPLLTALGAARAPSCLECCWIVDLTNDE